ncbi:hypothetical protein [Haloarcula brevis]|uniref:hypothetical protein n=1 Tax=Haloarcula brevis TaxID=3111453 RepID=UPI00300F15BE
MTDGGELEAEVTPEASTDSEADTASDETEQAFHEGFSTLELTLEEARRKYDDEEGRREAVENKISTVVTVDALFISFGALVNQGIHPLLLFLVLLPALASAGYGLYTIRSRDYDRPGKDIVDFHDYQAFDDVDEQRERHLLDYEVTVDSNREQNETKYRAFNRCIILTFLSLILLLGLPVADHFGIIDLVVQEARQLLTVAGIPLF